MVPGVLQPLFWRQGSLPEANSPPGPSRLEGELRLAAQFGGTVARSLDLQALFHEACCAAAEGSGATFASLLVHVPDERVFLLRAGIGWPEGSVGQFKFGADIGTAAACAWQSGLSVICNDLTSEGRFRRPDLLVANSVNRSISVAIPGDEKSSFGVLGVESSQAGEFAVHDAYFLQLLANSLSIAIGRSGRAALHGMPASEGIQHCDATQLRVRTDLGAIFGSVAAEMCGTVDPVQRAGFRRINQRVLALAALYDHPLGAHTDAIVDFGFYLRLLCNKIGAVADLSSRKIALDADTLPLAMERDRAIRLAIAVIELVAIAAEHAYPGGGPGQISVRLLTNGEDGAVDAVVTVADDGCGFAGSPRGSTGLGFVQRLVQQAGAVLAREDGAGTTWRITLAS